MLPPELKFSGLVKAAVDIQDFGQSFQSSTLHL